MLGFHAEKAGQQKRGHRLDQDSQADHEQQDFEKGCVLFDDDVVDEIITTFIREANYAREEIMFRRFPIGIYLYNGGYAFYTVAEVQRKDETEEQQRDVLWKPLRNRLLKPHRFPDGLSLVFYQETSQTPVALENEIPDEVTPQIVFVSDTDAIPFELLFSYGESEKQSVVRYPSGKVRKRDEA